MRYGDYRKGERAMQIEAIAYGTRLMFGDAPAGYMFSKQGDGFVRTETYSGYLYAPRQVYAVTPGGRLVELSPLGFRAWNPEDCGFELHTGIRVLSPHGLNLDRFDS